MNPEPEHLCSEAPQKRGDAAHPSKRARVRSDRGGGWQGLWETPNAAFKSPRPPFESSSAEHL